jgi:hypothetical protein
MLSHGISKPSFSDQILFVDLHEVANSIASQIYCSTGYITSIQVHITAIVHFISANGFVGKVFRRPCKPIGTYQHEKGKKSNVFDEKCLVCLYVSCVCSLRTLVPD